MKYFNRLNTALEHGLSNSIFINLRNFLICSLLLALGVMDFQQDKYIFFGLIKYKYAGIGFIGFSCILICLNLYDGIRKISKHKYHLLLTLGLIIIYVYISLRVIELALHFRIS